MDLSPTVQKVWLTVSSALPLERAMTTLMPEAPQASDICRAVAGAAQPLAPVLQAALYLYVDDLERGHAIAQVLDSAEGSYWHGITHRREGDFSNSKYWFRRAGSLPSRLNQDPSALTDQFASLRKTDPTDALAERQRQEWVALFEHCARGTS